MILETREGRNHFWVHLDEYDEVDMGLEIGQGALAIIEGDLVHWDIVGEKHEPPSGSDIC